jgi:DNA helicase-2/ATP-dependent DNA helicase PcrA
MRRRKRRKNGAAFSSRSRGRLRLYYTCRAQKQAREPSPFIAELGSFEIETLDVPSRTFLGPSCGVDPFELDSITFHDIRDFEKCPLRVAYRHQLAIRSRRHEGPHLMTGGVIYELIDRASELADAGPALEKTLLAAFARVWADRGPSPDHPLAADYERVGRRSLSGLRNLIDAHAGSGNAPVRLPIRGGQCSCLHRYSPPIRPKGVWRAWSCPAKGTRRTPGH